MITKSWRCTICALNWPPHGKYSTTCPVCGERTWSSPNTVPMSDDQATEIVDRARQDQAKERARRELHRKFDTWYEEREVSDFRAAIERAEIPQTEPASLSKPPPQKKTMFEEFREKWEKEYYGGEGA